MENSSTSDATTTVGHDQLSTPISASRDSILQAVIGDGTFEYLMKERTKVSKLQKTGAQMWFLYPTQG